MMLSGSWDNDVPVDSEKVSLCAGRFRQFKIDFRERINENIPVGAIMEWFTETVPDGFLECDGSSLAVASYYSLFLILGYRFGSIDYTDHFNLPDMRGLLVRCYRHGKTGVDLDADQAVSCTGDISGTAITNITDLAGVPRFGAIITGTGIPTDTYITAITGYDTDGIPTGFTISQSATTGTGIALTIDNDVIGSTQIDENISHTHAITSASQGEFVQQSLAGPYYSGTKVNTTTIGNNESRPKNIATMFIIRADTI